MTNISYSIIVPAYNEQESIKKVVEEIKQYAGNNEVIVVDDGSTDKTYDIVKSQGVTVVRHPSNKGYGAALKTGIKKASNEIIVLMDADGQHNPADIRKLIDQMHEQDMVVGSRTSGSHRPAFRQPGKRLLTWLANYLAETKIPDLNSGFRAIRKDVALKFIHILPNTFSFTTTITLALFKEGFNIKYVPIETKARSGRSTVNWFRDGLRTMLLILRTIMLFDPLKIFLPASVFMGIVSFAYLLYGIILDRNISDSTVILIVFTILLFFFGLLADQLAHIRRQIGLR